MILLFPEFKADEVFVWARDGSNRITVCCPALPMVTKCLGRVLREMHLGKTILVWGDPASIENLRHRLESSGIVTYGFMPSPGPKTALRS